MGGKSNYLENKILSLILGRTSYTPPAAIFVALFTASPDDSGGGAEVSGSGYSRKQITNNASEWDSSTDGERSNVNIVSFGTVGTGGWGTIVAFALMDNNFGGNMLYWGSLETPYETQDGDTVSFPSGSLVVTED